MSPTARMCPAWEVERGSDGLPTRMVLAGWYMRPTGWRRARREAREAKAAAAEATARRHADADARQMGLL